ncbi:recombinase family protein [Bacillus paranthracis]|uniref:recombinase family protein n=1 Tax=Bacillus paranthracis TaxID=2026186 RepID=UPI0021D3E921|nr:recombinase family protein [Bacillus paranthracis]MCU4954481.1 recombinase family protein [Bacillus paranthracis]
MKTAFVYLLKSMENDIEEQREKIGTYAKENDIEIIKEFVETDMLAALKHTELQTMIQDLVEKNDIDYVLVHQFDVLTHNMARLGWVITQLEEILNVKTKISSITEENKEDNYQLFQSMIHKIGAKEEQIRHTSRLQEGKKEKKQKGGFNGGTPPMGYSTQEGSGVLFIKYDEVPTVEHAFEWRKQGLTMQEVADKLNEYGFKTRQEREFKAMTVQRMLKNESLYKGEGEAPELLKKQGEYKMKQLKDLYKGIQFYQKDGKEGTYYGVSKDKIEKQANLIGTILIREEDVYTPCDWNINSEEFFIDEDKFNEYSYVLMNHEADDIYHALEEKYEDIFSKHGIEDKWDFISAEELPTEIYEELLQLIKEKDYKADFEQWEPTYSYFDGHNSQKISLDEYNGYYPCELDYVVKKGYRIDGDTSHSIFYITDEGTVIEDYNSYFQGDKSKYFHVLRIVEKENWGNIVKKGYEIEM